MAKEPDILVLSDTESGDEDESTKYRKQALAIPTSVESFFPALRLSTSTTYKLDAESFGRGWATQSRYWC